jgi:hypothetical protein
VVDVVEEGEDGFRCEKSMVGETIRSMGKPCTVDKIHGYAIPCRTVLGEATPHRSVIGETI